MATVTQSYGSAVSLSLAGLSGLVTSTTLCWQSVLVDNKSSLNAIDFEVMVYLAAVNTAPANDKAIYVYAIPWVENDSGVWYCADGAGTTLPTGTAGTITIGNPNNFKLLGAINNAVQNTVTSGIFNLSNSFGMSMPDGWSLVIQNYSGATLTTSGSLIIYRPIKQTVA